MEDKNNAVEEVTKESEEVQDQGDSNKEDENSKDRKALKYSDDDLDRIVNKKFAKWQKQQEKQINDLKEAQRLEKMNDDEKKDYTIEKLSKKIAEYERRENLNEMAKVAKSMLADSGFIVSDSLVSNLITDEAEKTKEIVGDFTKLLKDTVEREVNERLRGKSPTVKTSPTKSNLASRNEILGIKDTVKRRRLMAENKELFE